MLRKFFPDVYEGWIVVGCAGCIVMALGAIFFYGFGTIYNEVRTEFGWDNADTALAFSLRNEVGGMGAVLVGIAIDRIGARIVLFVGILMTASGVFIMSYMSEIWHFYVIMIYIALGSSAAAGQVGLTAIATWFRDRRTFAMSIMTLGGGIGGLFVVIIAWIVEFAGWRDALRVLALFMFILGISLAGNVRTRPQNHHQPLDGKKNNTLQKSADNLPEPIDTGVSVKEALKSRAFIFLSIALMGSSFGFVAIVVHQIPYFETQLGMSKSMAGSTIAIFTTFSIIGRFGFGWMADKTSKQFMLMIAIILLASGLIILGFSQNFWIALLGIIVAAPGFGGTIPLAPSMTADYFGTKYFGTINGLLRFVSTTGSATGPWVVGKLVDINGDYVIGWFVSAAVVLILGIPSILMLGKASTLQSSQIQNTV